MRGDAIRERLRWENPVFRHTGRLTTPRRTAAMLAGALLLVIVAAGLLQQYWLQYGIYSDRPRLYVRWFYLVVLAEVFIVLPWSAIRGATLWRLLDSDGHLDEYRRTRMPSLSVVLGALGGSLRPVAWFLGLSALAGVMLSLAGGATGEESAPTVLQTAGAHLLLLALAGCFAALGQLCVSWTRLPSLAVPLCLGLLALATGAILFLNPYYPRLPDPDRWIWSALLPNPLLAVGTLLRIDVLRIGWIYDHVRAEDYFSLGFSYPPPFITAVLYLALGGAAALLSAAHLARRDT